MPPRNLIILALGLLIGILIISQYYSFRDLQSLVVRDSATNVFAQLQTLKRTNEDLIKEIEDIEKQIEQFSNKAAANELVLKEIKKLKMLSGKVDVEGPGIRVIIDGDIEAIWLTDVINSLWNAGAEAISVNKIRLTSDTAGFSDVGKKQILLSGNLIIPPYEVTAIGNKKLLEKALVQSGGIVSALKASYKDMEVTIAQEEKILMEKI